MSHHIADHHTVSVLLQLFKPDRHLIGAVHRYNIQMIPQQITQCMRRFRNA